MNIEFFMILTASVHVLIGGMTGGGKSVLINGIIYAILQHNPHSRQLILIDPKRVELHNYRRVPHCIRYGDTPETMQAALNFAVDEMERRYSRMQAAEIKETYEPHIYIIIDELADLIDVCGKPAMNALKRLLQLGRAAHIHIIAATQHVNRRTIPAEMQVNFSCVVALPQRSKIESRQILDGEDGAELLTVGHCMYKTLTDRHAIHADVPMILETELKNAVTRWMQPAPKPQTMPQQTAQIPAAYVQPRRTPAPPMQRKPRTAGGIIKYILFGK